MAWHPASPCKAHGAALPWARGRDDIHASGRRRRSNKPHQNCILFSTHSCSSAALTPQDGSGAVLIDGCGYRGASLQGWAFRRTLLKHFKRTEQHDAAAAAAATAASSLPPSAFFFQFGHPISAFNTKSLVIEAPRLRAPRFKRPRAEALKPCCPIKKVNFVGVENKELLPRSVLSLSLSLPPFASLLGAASAWPSELRLAAQKQRPPPPTDAKQSPPPAMSGPRSFFCPLPLPRQFAGTAGRSLACTANTNTQVLLSPSPRTARLNFEWRRHSLCSHGVCMDE